MDSNVKEGVRLVEELVLKTSTAIKCFGGSIPLPSSEFYGDSSLIGQKSYTVNVDDIGSTPICHTKFFDK